MPFARPSSSSCSRPLAEPHILQHNPDKGVEHASSFLLHYDLSDVESMVIGIVTPMHCMAIYGCRRTGPTGLRTTYGGPFEKLRSVCARTSPTLEFLRVQDVHNIWSPSTKSYMK